MIPCKGLIQAIYDLWFGQRDNVKKAKEIRYDVVGYPEIKVILTWDWDYDIEGVFLEVEATGVPAPPETQVRVGWQAASFENPYGHMGHIINKLNLKRVYTTPYFNNTITTIDGNHRWIQVQDSIVYEWGAGVP